MWFLLMRCQTDKWKAARNTSIYLDEITLVKHLKLILEIQGGLKIKVFWRIKKHNFTKIWIKPISMMSVLKLNVQNYLLVPHNRVQKFRKTAKMAFLWWVKLIFCMENLSKQLQCISEYLAHILRTHSHCSSFGLLMASPDHFD